MLRTRHRISALALALVFVFAGSAEGMGIHRCPHHDVLPGAAEAAEVHEADAGHGAGHHAHTADTSAPAHENCTCMGACQPGSVATLAAPASAASAIDATAHPPTGWWSPPVPRASLVAFALPFANGPPAR